MTRRHIAAAVASIISVSLAVPLATWAQEAPTPAPSARGPVGLPQDAGPHDGATIEWWYFNSFLKTESGKEYAVVGSFFRTGLTPEKKGHYLIYGLTDLAAKKTVTASTLDKANRDLLQAFLPLAAMQRPDDPRPAQLLATLQKGGLPKPHRLTDTAKLTTAPRFSIAMAGSSFAQTSDDARKWKVTLADPKFSLSLDLSQPQRPPMLVGGEGKTGLGRADDMYYVSLTRAEASGTLTVNGKAEKVTGVGWVDRQWGTSWVVQDNGWDWFGVQLADGSDLIVYRIKDNSTGKTLRAEATLLRQDGTQAVDKAVTITPQGKWTDPKTKIAYPTSFQVKMGTLGHTLTMTPAFPDQTIPVIGIGDAIWEGVVNVTGTATGRGYMELVGYKAPLPPAKPAKRKTARR